MRSYSPRAVPNQVLDVTVDGLSFRISLRFFRGLLYATVADSAGAVLSGMVRCARNSWLLPFRRRSVNFRFECAEGSYPDYTAFGDTCFLVAYTAAEVASMEV